MGVGSYSLSATCTTNGCTGPASPTLNLTIDPTPVANCLALGDQCSGNPSEVKAYTFNAASAGNRTLTLIYRANEGNANARFTVNGAAYTLTLPRANQFQTITLPGSYMMNAGANAISLASAQGYICFRQLCADDGGTPPPPPPTGDFAITGVSGASCINEGEERRRVSFMPTYGNDDGSAITFSINNELSPTTAPGPYTLVLYLDKPSIPLSATQSGVTSTFAYNWQQTCTTPPPAPRLLSIATPAAQSAAPGQVQSGNAASELTPTGGTKPYAYNSVSSASSTAPLPGASNLTVNTTSGAYTYTAPIAPGTYAFAIRVCDAGSPTPQCQVAEYSVTVTAPATGTFAITGVSNVSCVNEGGNRRRITFTPTYANSDGTAITFSVKNEKNPTTAPGPYSLALYLDKPSIPLRAVQSGRTSTYEYFWQAACNGNARRAAESETSLEVTPLTAHPNPTAGEFEAHFYLAPGQRATLGVSDLLGRQVWHGILSGQGEHKEQIHLPEAASGMYFLRLQRENAAPGQSAEFTKVLVVK